LLKDYIAHEDQTEHVSRPANAPVVNNGKIPVKIFFYCCSPGRPENTAYHHQIICLAEGFKYLNIPFFANINYWQISAERGGNLINYDPNVTPDDCSIVILDHYWFLEDNNSALPKDLFSKEDVIRVYLEGSDWFGGYWKPEFRQFDFIFKSHYSTKCSHPSNVYPGAFGISNRILKETELIPTFQERRKNLLVNFRVKHSLRDIVRQNLVPAISNILMFDETIEDLEIPPSQSDHYLQWAQTGRRHHPNFYKRLIQSTACACFGGNFIPRWPSDPTASVTRVDRILNKIAQKLNLQSKRIIQWDSWRFWESLAAGCVTFHVDFEKYGFRLPVMPVNWRHYIGIDLDHIHQAVERIADEPEVLEKISTEGRLWALEHYSPVPTALRFLEIVGQKLSPRNGHP
jgi:hypothetical protein